VDFAFSEEQEAVADLAARIFAGQVATDRVKEIEATDDRFDRSLWAELARAGLLGLIVPEAQGGNGLGIMELCLLLEQQGRRLAPVPLWPTLALGALPLAEFGDDEQRARWLPAVAAGDAVLTAALAEPGANNPLATSVSARADGRAWRLDGTKPSVPAGLVADRVLVPAITGHRTLGVFLVDPSGPGVTLERAETTNREWHPHVTLDGAPAEPLGDPAGGSAIVEWTRQRALVGLCALQVGVAEEAVRQAAAYTSGRSQFGRPLSTFQGVALKAADAYIDTEAMRSTLWQAAWRLSEGTDAAVEVAVAKWWAAEGGHRIVHTTQHLHGGVGADIDYPIHRYFLWGKQIADMLGGAGVQLARLGQAVADATRRGQPVGAGA
jgi:acyl-CoA dehydrogenase